MAVPRPLRPLRSALPALALLVSAAAPALAEEPVPGAWRTVAERSDFRATGSYDDTMALLRRLAERSSAIELTRFGTSAEGRELPLVVVSTAGAFTPAAAARLAAERGTPIVLVQNGIHGGEIDGKDACLMLLRDIALGRRAELAAAATLLVVPIYNVDGAEKVSRFNRPNQNGPVEGMGFRTSSDGLDLNRDHLKVVSPEARAMVRLFDLWRPHLHVDDHVTDGSDHGWVLTWSVAEAPQLAAPLDAWIGRHLPAALAATAAAGHPNGPYVDLLDRADPTAGFSSMVAQPRYATGYYPLRNRPSVLVEMHATAPYRDRVLANRDFLAALLAEVGRDGRALVAAVAAAEAETVALGRAGAPPSTLALDWEASPAGDRRVVPFDDWSLEDSVAMGVPILTYRRGVPHPVEVPWLHAPVPTARGGAPARLPGAAGLAGDRAAPGRPRVAGRAADRPGRGAGRALRAGGGEPWRTASTRGSPG